MHRCLEIEGGQLHISDEPDLLLALSSHGEKCVPILNEKTRELDMTCFPFVVEDEEQVALADYTKMYHRLCGIPETVMITERLRIREITVDDLPELFLLYDDPDVTAYIEPLFPYEEEREYTANYIKYVYGLYGYGMWIVERKSGDSWEMIGRAGIEQKNERLEMGYMLGNAFRHMGYAYEACNAILSFAWENTDEQAVYCVVNKKNKASIRLLEKLGFLPHSREDMEGSESIYIKNRPNGL